MECGLESYVQAGKLLNECFPDPILKLLHSKWIVFLVPIKIYIAQRNYLMFESS